MIDFSNVAIKIKFRCGFSPAKAMKDAELEVCLRRLIKLKAPKVAKHETGLIKTKGWLA